MVVGGPPGLFLVALVLSRTFALPQPPLPAEDVSDYDIEKGPANIFLRQTRKHARPMFYINCGYRDLCYCYSKITRHHYCCSCDVGACFPGSARVATSHKEFTTMDKLRTGDEVLAVNEYGEVVTSSVLGFMDRRPNERSLYVTLHTTIGRNLTLSPNHVLFKSTPNSSYPISVFGSDISVGDVIFSVNKTGLQLTRVMAIHYTIIRGAYVPLTKEGTLIVDDCMASCYASYRHSLAHAFLAPVRAFPFLLRPRPGFLSNIYFLLVNIINEITERSFELLKDFFVGKPIYKDLVSIGHYSRSTDHHFAFKSDSAEMNVMETDLYPRLSEPDVTDFEDEGEAYYITLVKFIGWLLFRNQKADSPVIQVNTQPHWKPFSLTYTYANLPSTLLTILPRSW